MSRIIAVAVVLGALGSSAIAAPQNQLIAPNLNPGLRTVPSVPHSYNAGDLSGCTRSLAAHVDSGTVITGPNGRVAHVTGMAASGGAAEVVITSVSDDGRTATADLMVCNSPVLESAAYVQAAMQVTDADLEAISIRTQSNVIVLKIR